MTDEPITKPERRCGECGSELSYCGSMSIDGPLLDCKVCQLRDTLSQSEAENHRLQQKINRLRTEAELRDVEIQNLQAQLHDKGLLE